MALPVAGARTKAPAAKREENIRNGRALGHSGWPQQGGWTNRKSFSYRKQEPGRDLHPATPGVKI